MAEEKTDASSSKPRFTLGYWKIRGLAQPARLILAYGGQSNFEDVTYELGPQWFDVKFKMGLDFPNLPYLIDHTNKVRLTESHAIYRYLARELKIGSSDSQGRAYEEMIGDTFKDLFGQWTQLCYSKDFESLKDGFIKKLPDLLGPLESWLKGADTDAPRKWLGGKNLCYADFILFEFIDQTSKLCGHVYEKFPELTRFYKAFKALEPLQDFFKTDCCCRYTLNGASALFK